MLLTLSEAIERSILKGWAALILLLVFILALLLILLTTRLARRALPRPAERTRSDAPVDPWSESARRMHDPGDLEDEDETESDDEEESR
ncbi:MAG: hypothetical protein GC162_08185 [Planctomycetes bacterium]|nr:hypothetical protein [Planctomycetota bacterium]